MTAVERPPTPVPEDPPPIPAASPATPADAGAARSATPADAGAGRPAPLRARWAIPLSVVAGGLLLLAFPLYDQWWLAPFGVAALALAAHRQRLRTGFLAGLLAGLTLFVPMLQWTHIVGGVLPWALLAIMEACYVGVLGLCTAWASPLTDRYRWMWPLLTGALWVGQEALRDRTPFGGFPWGRLAFSQSDSPLLRTAVLGGAPLVTFLTAVVGGLLVLAATAGFARRYRSAVLVALGAVLIPIAALAVPTSAPTGPAVRVAIVQGNVPRLGLEFNAQRRAVLDNHVKATLALAEQVQNGQQPQPDLVIWPENASDIDPLVADDPQDDDAAAEIQEAADAIDAPILVGAVLEGPGDHARNAGIVWLPGSGPQSGPHGMYVKRHPVPFGEYIPLRSIAEKVTKKVDLVRNDFVPGPTPGVLTMGPATVGDVICFEVAYDDIVRDTVTGGAQLLTVQTNNADFNTSEARQQMAMVRLRAVEHGRDAMMVSTVGISGFVNASGAVHQTTGFNTAETELRTLRLGRQTTLATNLGELPEFVICGAALAALIAAAFLRRRRPGAPAPSGPPEESA